MEVLPNELWDGIIMYLDLSSIHTLWQLFPALGPIVALRFSELLQRELTAMRDGLEKETVGRRSVLLFLVGVFLYNPRTVQRLSVDPFLPRFVRFFQDIPRLVEEEKQVLEQSFLNKGSSTEFVAPSLLRRLLQEYGLALWGIGKN